MRPWHAYVPRPIVRATYNNRNRMRAAVLTRLWGMVDLDYKLSGLTIRIKNRSDWIIYNEIFVKRVYDPAIEKMLEMSPGRALNIVDLGANVGFFAVRVAHVLQVLAPSVSYRITLVEGSPLVHRDLESRIGDEPRLRDKVTLVHGLVGQRTGSAKIFESASFGAGNSLFATNIPQGVDVAFVDLSPIFAGDSAIDLLKCDIEGSELILLENYGDLLAKTKVAVFEFHPDWCDVPKCKRILAEAGFNRQTDLGDLQLYWKG